MAGAPLPQGVDHQQREHGERQTQAEAALLRGQAQSVADAAGRLALPVDAEFGDQQGRLMRRGVEALGADDEDSLAAGRTAAR